MRSFDWASLLRTALYTFLGGLLAALALFADPGFVAEALSSLPSWAQTLVTVFVGGIIGGIGRALDGVTFKR